MSDQELRPDHELDWAALAAAIFSAKGINEGLWRVALKMRFAGLTTNWNNPDGSVLTSPTGLVGIEGVVLFKADEPGPMVYCASAHYAAANPVVKRTRSAKKAARSQQSL